MGEVGKGLEYLKSPGSLLKMAELAIVLIAAGAVGYFHKEGPENDYEKKDRIEFFLAAAGIAAAVVVVFFLIFLAGLHKKVKIAWTKTAAGVFILMGVLMLVASAMLTDAYMKYKNNKLCDTWENLKALGLKAQCKQLLVGLIGGFISAVVFVVDAVFHFMM